MMPISPETYSRRSKNWRVCPFCRRRAIHSEAGRFSEITTDAGGGGPHTLKCGRLAYINTGLYGVKPVCLPTSQRLPSVIREPPGMFGDGLVVISWASSSEPVRWSGGRGAPPSRAPYGVVRASASFFIFVVVVFFFLAPREKTQPVRGKKSRLRSHPHPGDLFRDVSWPPASGAVLGRKKLYFPWAPTAPARQPKLATLKAGVYSLLMTLPSAQRLHCTMLHPAESRPSCLERIPFHRGRIRSLWLPSQKRAGLAALPAGGTEVAFAALRLQEDKGGFLSYCRTGMVRLEV